MRAPPAISAVKAPAGRRPTPALRSRALLIPAQARRGTRRGTITLRRAREAASATARAASAIARHKQPRALPAAGAALRGAQRAAGARQQQARALICAARIRSPSDKAAAGAGRMALQGIVAAGQVIRATRHRIRSVSNTHAAAARTPARMPAEAGRGEQQQAAMTTMHARTTTHVQAARAGERPMRAATSAP